MKKFLILFSCLVTCLVAEPYTVIVILEAKAGSEDVLAMKLDQVAALSSQEESNVTYQVFQDAHNPVKFALYEQWVSPELHKEQFTKPYIHEFITDATPLLAKPYEVVTGYRLKCN